MYSNLAQFDYKKGNHMVLAVSEESVNTTLKQKLNMEGEAYNCYIISNISGGEVVYFEINKNTDMHNLPAGFPVELKNKDLFSIFEEADLFSRNYSNEDDKKIIEKLYDAYYLEKAYQFIPGIPTQFSMGDLKRYQPIKLIASTDPSNCGCEFTQYFEDVIILEVTEKRDVCSVGCIKQSDCENPWGVVYKVLFQYKREEFDKLPLQVQNNIKYHFEDVDEAEIENIFDISQLILDFTTLSQVETPKITGVTEESEIMVVNAINKYVEHEYSYVTSDDYLVIPNKNNDYNYLFKPCEYTYSVTKDTNNLKTLNYIMTTSHDDKITPQLYEWEWLSDDDLKEETGVMSINRETVFDIFNNEFKDKVLPKLWKRFVATMEDNSKICDKPDFDYYIEDSKKSGGDFEYKDKKYIYPKLEERSESELKYEIFPIYTAKHAMTYTVDCSCYWQDVTIANNKYPGIVYKTTVKLYEDLTVDSGTTSGYVYDADVYCEIGISIDGQGKIELKRNARIDDRGESMGDTNFWSKLFSLGVADDAIKDAVSDLQEMTKGVVSDFEETFLSGKIGYASWVLPGGKTFTFKNQEFCDEGDFVIGTRYVEPV